MKNISVFILTCVLTVFTANAQTDVDALRFSQTNSLGTARSVGMAGAFGALGADFYSLSVNPAGLAVYRKPEVMLTPMVFSKKTGSSFLGNKSSDEKFGFSFGNAGLVAVSEPRNKEKHGWQTINVGIGYNRLNSYNTLSSFSGMNATSSYLDYYLQRINAGNGTNPADLNPFFENLAYQTYLINPVDTVDTTHYTSVIPHAGTLQRRNENASGSLGEVVASLGGNYKDRLYLGMSLGFVFLNYTENTSFQETDKMDTIPDFKEFTLNQNLITEGKGFNLKLGMIFRATDWVRLGVAVHTPTLFDMTDNYTSQMKSSFDNGVGFDHSAKGKFDYELTTPLKAIASAAFIIHKQGAISIDYEVVNYADMRFSSSGDAFFDVNNTIQNKYTSTGNVHIGGEWKYENFSFRGGYSIYGSPFRSGMNYPGADFSRTKYSAGIGIRDEKYFLDFGYSITMSKEFFRPYSLNNIDVEGSINTLQSQNISVTMGFKF